MLVMNANNFALEKTIAVGDNPNEMCVSKNGRYLFVANANDNSVSVIDAKQAKVIETLNAALYPDAPSGSTSNGVALSGDEKTLYIANADNNCLAVFDFIVLWLSLILPRQLPGALSSLCASMRKIDSPN